MAPIGDLLHTASTLIATCTKNVARAAKRVRRRYAAGSSTKLQRGPSMRKKKASAIVIGGGSLRCYIIFVRGSKKVSSGVPEDDKHSADKEAETEMDTEEDAAVWQRTILMGEKCEPLNFPGVIYYDNEGRQVPEMPMPRTPRTPQRSFDRLGLDGQQAARHR